MVALALAGKLQYLNGWEVSWQAAGGCQDRGAACPHSFSRVWGNQQDPGEREKLGERWGRIDLGINEGRQKMEGEENGPRGDKRDAGAA